MEGWISMFTIAILVFICYPEYALMPLETITKTLAWPAFITMIVMIGNCAEIYKKTDD